MSDGKGIKSNVSAKAAADEATQTDNTKKRVRIPRTKLDFKTGNSAFGESSLHLALLKNHKKTFG